MKPIESEPLYREYEIALAASRRGIELEHVEGREFSITYLGTSLHGLVSREQAIMVAALMLDAYYAGVNDMAERVKKSLAAALVEI